MYEEPERIDTPVSASASDHHHHDHHHHHGTARDFAYQNGDRTHIRHPSIEDPDRYIRPKKLIVCCDGTWMDSDGGEQQNPSNVTRISRAIAAEDQNHHPQIVYYQAGIGTGIGLWNHIVGGGTGAGLGENIREAYAFLVSNYRPEEKHRLNVPADSIFLVGFSRGAFTARSIAGLIGAVGLLKKKAMPHFYDVFDDWENAAKPGYKPKFFDSYFVHHRHEVKDPEEIKQRLLELTKHKSQAGIDHYFDEYFKVLLSLDCTQEVTIKSIGVWDTVGALGIPVNPWLQRIIPNSRPFIRDYCWFDTRLDRHIKNAFQALALDEHRYPFSPTLWERPKDIETNLKQVWFPGSHSNVGGSYEDAGMANITLAWMMDQLSGNTMENREEDFHHHDWIQFDTHYIHYWQDCESDYYNVHPKQQGYRGWAMGKVYDTVYFPQSLTGTTVREPAKYHRTDNNTGRRDKQHLLTDTQERMHASVRARVDLAGNPVQPDWAQVFPNSLSIWPLIKYYLRRFLGLKEKTYQPQAKGEPLHKWRLEDGHKSHFDPNMDIDMSPDAQREVVWVYEGDGDVCTREMPEDRLGKFELELLKKDQKHADQIEYSNNAWHWYRRNATHRRARHSLTSEF